MGPSRSVPEKEITSAWWLKQGDSRAVIWTFACHPTSFFDRNAVSSEYIGLVRENLRAHYNAPDLPVLFIQGASGDLREPFFSRSPRLVGWLKSIEGLLSGVKASYITPTRSQWTTWAEGLADTVIQSLEQSEKSELHSINVNIKHDCIAVDDLFDGEHPVDTLHLWHASLSDSLGLVLTNAEITAALAASVRAGDSWKPTWKLATCVAQSLGYIATDEQMSEGGYECSTWPSVFGCQSQPTSTLPGAFADLVKRLT